MGASLAFVVAVVIVGAREQRARAASRVCRGAEARWAGVWDAHAKEAIRSAFVATGAPKAEDTWRSLEQTIDVYAWEWVSARTDACEATSVRREQSAATLDVRMACLDERRTEGRCARARASHRRPWRREALGHGGTGARADRRVRPRAGPRRAGEAKEAKEAKDILERAATEADAVGDDRLRAKALSALIFVLGEGGTANISFLRNQALAALGRSGGDVALEAVLHINVATALMSDARRDEARVELERTLAILGELHEEHANNAEAARNNLAIIDLEEGKPDAAIAESNQVLDDIERSVGKLHPLRADAFDNRGLARAQLLDFAGAASDFAGAASDFA